jgi:hypothetical protein
VARQGAKSRTSCCFRGRRRRCHAHVLESTDTVVLGRQEWDARGVNEVKNQVFLICVLILGVPFRLPLPPLQDLQQPLMFSAFKSIDYMDTVRHRHCKGLPTDLSAQGRQLSKPSPPLCMGPEYFSPASLPLILPYILPWTLRRLICNAAEICVALTPQPQDYTMTKRI